MPEANWSVHSVGSCKRKEKAERDLCKCTGIKASRDCDMALVLVDSHICF
jgi:hypothetical protein